MLKFWNSFFHLRKNRLDKFSPFLFLRNISINFRRKLTKINFFEYKNIEKRINTIVEKAKSQNKNMNKIAYTYNSGFNLYFWNKNEIFPLRKIKFEELEFNAPNNSDSYLKINIM